MGCDDTFKFLDYRQIYHLLCFYVHIHINYQYTKHQKELKQMLSSKCKSNFYHYEFTLSKLKLYLSSLRLLLIDKYIYAIIIFDSTVSNVYSSKLIYSGIRRLMIDSK